MNRQDHELAEHDPWLRRLARRLARTRTRADDLVQDTYVTALRNAPPEVQMRPWLQSVMRKLAWGQVRSEQRRIQREDGFSLTAPSVTLPDVLPDHGVDRERLGEAIASLPEPFQSTIVQRFFEGQSCADIARRERVPAGTVRWRQARGLELLREGLAPPRRRFAIWALPFLGVGEQIVARCWQAIVSRLGGSKAIWLLLACAAVLYAIVGARPPHGVLVAAGDDRRDGIALADVSDPLPTSLMRAGGKSLAGQRLGAGLPGAGSGDELAASQGSDGAALAAREAWRDALERALDIHHDDCTWDPVHGRRCPGSDAASMDAVCSLLHQQLLAGQALVLASPTGRGMLSTALLANRARAQRLGCPSDDGDQPRTGGKSGGKPGGASKPADGTTPPQGEPPPPAEPPPTMVSSSCSYQYDDAGNECTVCPGQETVCSKPACQLRTIATGVVCSICVTPNGFTFADCPVEISTSCHSEVSATGMVCSTCDGQSGPPECLPAQCTLANGCLTCTDPKDRSATDCSAIAGQFEGGTTGGNAGDMYFGSCTTTSGSPRVAGVTCHYPGTQSCIVSEYPSYHCLQCVYRDGSGVGECAGSEVQLMDPFADRPNRLPAPGHCISELGPDGSVTCETCTRADMSATSSCL